LQYEYILDRLFIIVYIQMGIFGLTIQTKKGENIISLSANDIHESVLLRMSSISFKILLQSY